MICAVVDEQGTMQRQERGPGGKNSVGNGGDNHKCGGTTVNETLVSTEISSLSLSLSLKFQFQLSRLKIIE